MHSAFIYFVLFICFAGAGGSGTGFRIPEQLCRIGIVCLRPKRTPNAAKGACKNQRQR